MYPAAGSARIAAAEPRARLPAIAREFGTVGAVSVGSGRQLYLLDACVRRLKWVSVDEFGEGMSLSQLVPGANITNLTIYLGWLVHGVVGGVVAFLALLAPGLAAIVLAAAVLRSGNYPALVNGALSGAAAISVALVLALIVRTAPAIYRRARGAPFIAVGAFLMVGPLQVGVLPTLLVFGGLSIWLNRPGTQPSGGGEKS